MIEQYQTSVLRPDFVVDYASEMMQKYLPEQLAMEPMVGMRVLCTDTQALTMNPVARMEMIDRHIGVGPGQGGILNQTGCILREAAPMEAPNGIWVITCPVPQSQLVRQLDNLNLVLNRLAQGLGIISMEVVDINVSGRCAIGETEARMSNILIPPEYRNVLAEPTNTPYKIGHLIRINDQFALLRTRWDWSNKRSVNSVNHHYQDLLIIPQLLMGMFR